jgi:hypothetical protein
MRTKVVYVMENEDVEILRKAREVINAMYNEEVDYDNGWVETEVLDGLVEIELLCNDEIACDCAECRACDEDEDEDEDFEDEDDEEDVEYCDYCGRAIHEGDEWCETDEGTFCSLGCAAAWNEVDDNEDEDEEGDE